MTKANTVALRAYPAEVSTIPLVGSVTGKGAGGPSVGVGCITYKGAGGPSVGAKGIAGAASQSPMVKLLLKALKPQKILSTSKSVSAQVSIIAPSFKFVQFAEMQLDSRSQVQELHLTPSKVTDHVLFMMV